MLGVIDVGGGMRDIYGAGIFDYCLEHNLYFDYFIGVSAGSANGTAYIAKQAHRNYDFYTKYSTRKEYMSFHNLITKGNYIDLDYIYGTLTNEDGEYPLDYKAFMENPCDIEIIATEAITGEATYFQKEDIQENKYDFLKMSSCVPVINQPYPYKDHVYYDGGLSNPIPYQYAFDKGCDFVVIVLTRPKHQMRLYKKDSFLASFIPRQYPGTIEALCNRAYLYNTQLASALLLEEEKKVLILAPDDIGDLQPLTIDQEALDQLYHKGYNDAKALEEVFQKYGKKSG